MSVTFRDMANNSSNKHQWIVLDGDIDAGVVRHMCCVALTRRCQCQTTPLLCVACCADSATAPKLSAAAVPHHLAIRPQNGLNP